MFKIRKTEKSMKNKNKITLESPLKLSKGDIKFLFNKKIKKLNIIYRENKYLINITFFKGLNNNLIYFLNFF